jgi:hypothetical protein
MANLTAEEAQEDAHFRADIEQFFFGEIECYDEFHLEPVVFKCTKTLGGPREVKIGRILRRDDNSFEVQDYNQIDDGTICESNFVILAHPGHNHQLRPLDTFKPSPDEFHCPVILNRQIYTDPKQVWDPEAPGLNCYARITYYGYDLTDMAAQAVGPHPSTVMNQGGKRKRGNEDIGRNVKVASDDAFSPTLLQGIGDVAPDDNTRTAQAALAGAMDNTYPSDANFDATAALTSDFGDTAQNVGTGNGQTGYSTPVPNNGKPPVGTPAWHTQRKQNHKDGMYLSPIFIDIC